LQSVGPVPAGQPGDEHLDADHIQAAYEAGVLISARLNLP